MPNFLNSIHQFHRLAQTTPLLREELAKVAQGASPEAAMITCADSRIDPMMIMSAKPGTMYVHRNLGNMVPPYRHGSGTSEAAALSVFAGVRDIFVLGHFNCLMMSKVLEGTNLTPEQALWAKHAAGALRLYQEEAEATDADLSPVDRLSQINVRVQLTHLASYPDIQEAVSAGRLNLHGLWLDFKQSKVSLLKGDRFVPIDDER